MCRAAPLLVTRIQDGKAWVKNGDRDQAVSLLIEGVAVGDYVYCHAGVAIERLSPEEAEEVLELLAEINGLLSDPDFPLAANP